MEHLDVSQVTPALLRGDRDMTGVLVELFDEVVMLNRYVTALRCDQRKNLQRQRDPERRNPL
jgi:hypothetical protein